MSRLGRSFPRRTYAPRTKRAAGPPTLFGQSTVANTVAITTSGVRKTFGSSTVALTDPLITAGRRTTFSSSVAALTDTITTAGRRKAFGQSVVSLIDTITTIPAPLFPTVGVLDNFNRANGALGSNWTGNLDTGSYPMPTISGNAMVLPNTDQPYAARWLGGTYGPNYEVYVTLGSWSVNDQLYLVARTTDVGSSAYDRYEARLLFLSAITLQLQLRRVLNGTSDYVSIAPVNVSPSLVQAGDVIGLRVEGTTVRLLSLRSGRVSILMSAIDATPLPPSVGYIGVWMQNTTAVGLALDDFGGGTFGLVTGVSSVTLTDNIATSGSRKTFGQSVVTETDNVTTVGSRKTFGQSTLAATASITTAGQVGRTDAATGTLNLTPSGSEVYTPGALIYSDAATGAITFTPSAAEVFAGLDSATVSLAFSLTSADVFVGADAATEVFALTPSSTDVIERTRTDAATGIVSLVPLSSEVFAATDSAAGTLSLVPSAADTGQRVEVGSVSIVLAASSNDVLVATDSGTGQLALVPSGVESSSAAGVDTGIGVFKFTPSASETLQTTDAAITPVALLPSGTESRVVTDANAASLSFTPSAAETQLTVDTATALVTFSPSPIEFLTGVDSATPPVVFLPSSSEGRESVDVATGILALSPGSIDVYERVDVAAALLRLTPDSQEAGFIFFDAATVYLSLSGHAILFELTGAMRRIYGARIRHRLGRSGLYRPINSRLSRVYSGGAHD